jgi:hypothetical protein
MIEFVRTRRCPQKYLDACGTQLRRARRLVRPEHTGLPTWQLHLGYGMGHGPHPTSVVTTRKEVGLLMQ